MSHADAALTVAIALAVGVIVQCVARSIRIPAIILLLAAGVALGPTGLGWVEPASLGGGLFAIVDFAVAVILFEGALNLEIGRLRREERAIRRLVTWAALVTMVLGMLAARWWLGWSWSIALLFGSLVVVTGPTVVGPLVRDLRLRPRLQTVLEAEGVLIDPVGALLAVLVLQVTLAADAGGYAAEGRNLLLRLVVGTVLGGGGAFLIALLLRLPQLVHGLENILTLALVMLLFHLGEHVVSQSGLLAVTVAGLVVGNLGTGVSEDLREFKDQLTILLIGAIFVLLAADIGLTEIRGLGWPGVGVLATLVLIVRPAGAWLATQGTGLSWRERVFIAAIAPRGIVAAAIASLTAGALAARGMEGGEALRGLVFLVIAGTVVSAGVLAWPLSTLLGLRLPARDRYAILGAQGLGLALAGELKRAGASVVFIDNDPQRCRAAESAGFPVIYGDALRERTLLRVPIELVGTAIGATFNDNVNSQFVRFARQAFGVGVGLVAVDSLDGQAPPEHVARHGSDVLFDGPHDQERWDVRWRHDDVALVRCEFQAERAQRLDEAARAAERRRESYVVLTHERAGKVTPMSLSKALRKGDRALVMLHPPSRTEALSALDALGWQVVGEG